MAWAHTGVDVSWPQNSYMPTGQGFEIVGAFTNDGGGAFVTHQTYHTQVDNAIGLGEDHGIYIFNGPGDQAVAFAQYCAANLYRFGPNDSVWLDVETQSNGNPAYTPAQALAFIQEFHRLTGIIPGVYLNASEMNSFDWSALVAYGVLLWLAYYHPYLPPLKWWSVATMQQYTSTPLDQDYSLLTQAEIRIKQEGNTAMTPEQAAQLLQVYNQTQQITNALFFGGGSMKDGGHSISQSLADIHLLEGHLAITLTDAQAATIATQIASHLPVQVAPSDIAAALQASFTALPAAVVAAEGKALANG